ncbi:MAG: hypothetical protein IPG38_11510 [Chitinophagaceae bacterium]|nr:hypothetical protein [Chitinophagaceae bacterium]
MKTTIFNLFFAVVISGLAFTSCKKTDLTEMTATPNAAGTANANNAVKPSTGTASILNQDLSITYARDNGVDITLNSKTLHSNLMVPIHQATPMFGTTCCRKPANGVRPQNLQILYSGILLTYLPNWLI